MVTAPWLSSAVENVCEVLVGIVVFFSMSLVMMPPSVSMPSDSGVTSSSSTSFTSPASTPPWMAAPTATASSGFTSLRGSLPKNSFTYFCTSGMRVWPPTRMTSAMSCVPMPASFNAMRQGSMVRFTSSSTRLSSLARVSLMLRCLGPDASAVMYGRFTSVCWLEDSSILVFSAASLRRCTASGSLRTSTPDSLRNSSARKLMMRLSKSSPPRNVSPLVDSTSNWRSPSISAISMTDTSNVPPPRSYTDDLAVLARLVEAIGQRGRGRLVDDALDVETGDAAGVLGRLALLVVEVRRHRDDGLGHFFTEIVLGGLLHLHEHARGNFRRRLLFVLGFDPGVAVVGLHDLVGHHVDVLLHDGVVELAADEALDGEQRVLRIGDRLALGRLAHQDFVVLGERDDGRRGAITLAVLDDARLAAFHDGDAGIRGSQIDADYLAHTNLHSLFIGY